MRYKDRDIERDYKLIQKQSRGLNRVPVRTYIFACLNQLSCRCHKKLERERKREKERERFLAIYTLILTKFRKEKDIFT